MKKLSCMFCLFVGLSSFLLFVLKISIFTLKENIWLWKIHGLLLKISLISLPFESIFFVNIHKVSIHEDYLLENLMKIEKAFDFAYLSLYNIKYLFEQNKVLKQVPNTCFNHFETPFILFSVMLSIHPLSWKKKCITL